MVNVGGCGWWRASMAMRLGGRVRCRCNVGAGAGRARAGVDVGGVDLWRVNAMSVTVDRSTMTMMQG